MNDGYFDSIPKERTLDHNIMASKINDLIEFYINNIDRGFPFKKFVAKNGRGMFLTFAYVAKNTYRSILFLCDMVSKDPARRIEYSISSIPLLRVILEEIFTLVFISEDVEKRIEWYHKAGWRESKEEYDRCLALYGKDNNWATWFMEYQNHLDKAKKLFDITATEFSNPEKNILRWPTPGRMKNHVKSSVLTDFMQYLQDWYYKQFSQASHLTYPGLAVMGSHFLPSVSATKENNLKKLRSDCAFHSITLILAFFSEVENILKFSHKEELKYLWTVVGEYWEYAKELYDRRYQSLLKV